MCYMISRIILVALYSCKIITCCLNICSLTFMRNYPDYSLPSSFTNQKKKMKTALEKAFILAVQGLPEFLFHLSSEFSLQLCPHTTLMSITNGLRALQGCADIIGPLIEAGTAYATLRTFHSEYCTKQKTSKSDRAVRHPLITQIRRYTCLLSYSHSHVRTPTKTALCIQRQIAYSTSLD